MEIAVSSSIPQRFICSSTRQHDSILLYCGEPQQKGSLHRAQLENGKWNIRPLTVSGLNVLSDKYPQFSFGNQGRYVYLSLPDRDNDIYVLNSSASSATCSLQTRLETGFESPVFGIWPVCKRHTTQSEVKGFTFVISHQGEVALIDDTDHQPLLCRVKDFQPSFKKVLSASQTDSDCITVIGRTAENVHLCIIRLHDLEMLTSVKISCSLPVFIADPLRQASDTYEEMQYRIIHFALTSKCLCVLYEGGKLCFFQLQAKQEVPTVARKGLDFLSSPLEEYKTPPSLTASMYHALVLRPSLPGVKISDVEHERGGFVQDFGQDFFVVGYGHHISVWDRKYLCGHGYVSVDNIIRQVCPSRSSEKSVFVSGYGLHELQIVGGSRSGAVSLAMAVKRKGICDDLIESVIHGSTSAPIRSHPLSTAPIKAVADANCESSKLFEAHIMGEDEKEDNVIRALLTKSKTPTAESMLSLIQEWTGRNNGALSDPLTMGLWRKPSERLAAVTTARCLYELVSGDLKFLVPLMDMLGTGCVSNEAVLAVADISDSWDMGIGRKPFRLSSIIDPLMLRSQYSYALEAAVSGVADLPEQDVVKVLRYATRLADLSKDEEQNTDMLSTTKPHNDLVRIKRERAHRLFEGCLISRTDTGPCVEAIQKVPFSDALILLAHFKAFLTKPFAPILRAQEILPVAQKNLRTGVVDVAFDCDAASSYRGMRNWIDTSVSLRKRRTAMMKGCISWACNTVDAHLSTLVLDESGRELAEQLLQAVKDARKESEALRALRGLAGHLENGKGVPSGPDGLYNRRVVLVPRHVALL
eukprot:TRINITY_DN32_c0_g1_i1.p1 TRINITY_DN32_c0_g1~~TRINITY_DN32_c0_g1_i1.p1  ORF type:complete len:813 (+),score=86.60 TRINITY_DN32_c0_g1_i1:2191-4629(+)